MKVFAKFLTFWMNYKQIATIEYLDFSSGGDVTLKYSRWKRFDRPALEKALYRGGKYLCRVRTITNKDLQDEFTDYMEGIEQDLLDKKELFELPIYNEYFILEEGPVDPTLRPELPPEPEPEPEPEDGLQGIPEPGGVGDVDEGDDFDGPDLA